MATRAREIADRNRAYKKLTSTPRSEEEMSELAREVARGNKYAKGGKVGSASSRADGIAQRGKTRGTMVMCGGGMAKGKR